MTTPEHKAKYDAVIDQMGGLNAFRSQFPISVDYIARALAAGDQHLNTIPLHVWDRLAGRIHCGPAADAVGDYRMFPHNWPKGLSLAERVCTLKRVATRLAEEHTDGSVLPGN